MKIKNASQFLKRNPKLPTDCDGAQSRIQSENRIQSDIQSDLIQSAPPDLYIEDIKRHPDLYTPSSLSDDFPTLETKDGDELCPLDLDGTLPWDARLEALYKEFVLPFRKAGDTIDLEGLPRTLIVLFSVTTGRRAIQLMVHHQRESVGHCDLAPRCDLEGRMLIRRFESRYRRKLTEDDLETYLNLDTNAQAAFRTCRYLAWIAKSRTLPLGQFHLSCRRLGTRLGLSDPDAQKVLKTLIKLHVIEEIEKGLQWQAGMPKQATRYGWLFDPPAVECSD